jgi:cyclopropane fatty-acyl-phospholipid synthase-like methyltransferase
MEKLEMFKAEHDKYSKIVKNGSIDGNLYKSRRNQTSSFREVLYVLKRFPIKSVLDVGCGVGDFVLPLFTEFPGISYTGVDIMSKFIEIASERYCNSKDDISFELVENNQFSMDPKDAVVGIGLISQQDFNWWDQFIGMLSKMWESCNQVTVLTLFNEYTLEPDKENLRVITNEELFQVLRNFNPTYYHISNHLRNHVTTFAMGK